MLEFVFMDLDDTILDFHKAEAIALTDTLEYFGVTVTDTVISRYSVINLSQWELLELGKLTRDEVKVRRFRLLFEELGIVCDAEEVRKYYEKRLSVGHYFLPGAVELLDTLKGRCKLYIVSNGTTSVQQGRIKSAGIAHYFEAIWLSEAVGYVKPQKEFFAACFSQIPNFDPARAIILGDSLTSDILGGINGGIRTCWFNPQKKDGRRDIVPDFEIASLDEFVSLIEDL